MNITRTAGLVALLVALLALAACSSLLAESRFRKAIENNDLDYIKQNISSVDINRTFRDKPGFLASAVKQQRNEIVELLIQHGADCNLPNGANNSTPLQSAVFYDNPEAAELLLATGADPDQMGSGFFVAIVYAAGQGRNELVEILLKSGCDVNATDMYGRTALHRASAKGNLAMVQLLLDYHADAAIKDLEGNTPIDLAREAGNEDVINVLKPFSK